MKNDASLLTLVQEALAGDSKLNKSLDNIRIFVNDGAVMIAGSVTQRSLKALAKDIVSSIPGVNLVIEDLTVEPAPSRRVGVEIDWTKGSMTLL